MADKVWRMIVLKGIRYKRGRHGLMYRFDRQCREWVRSTNDDALKKLETREKELAETPICPQKRKIRKMIDRVAASCI